MDEIDFPDIFDWGQYDDTPDYEDDYEDEE
jgi:hypothetical protein